MIGAPDLLNAMPASGRPQQSGRVVLVFNRDNAYGPNPLHRIRDRRQLLHICRTVIGDVSDLDSNRYQV